MALDLNNLAGKVKMGEKMPESTRGRTAAPIPEALLKAVRDSYALPEGQGVRLPVPNGEKTDKGKDANVSYVVGQLRKAATSFGYGISINVQEPQQTQTVILFRAKTKTERVRRTKEELTADKLRADMVAQGRVMVVYETNGEGDEQTTTVRYAEESDDNSEKVWADDDDMLALGGEQDEHGVWTLPDDDDDDEQSADEQTGEQTGEQQEQDAPAA